MAGLGGGDAELLQRYPQERAKFIQMAGVLLTTSGIAVISMTFALHDGVHEPLYWAIPFGLIWGVIILNLDRFLVLSMGSIREKWRLFWIFLPRLAMAVVLALVISTPLVLRIFARDISEELFIIHQQASAQQAKLVANSSKAREAGQVERQIQADNSILAGHLPVTVTNPQLQQAQSLVTTLTPQVQAAQAAEIRAREAWQCELYGVGPHCDGNSGIPGPGPISRAKEQLYNAALATYSQLAGELASAKTALAKAQADVRSSAANDLVKYQAQARQSLPALKKRYAELEAYLRNTIEAGTRADNQNTGILAQLQALSAASAHNSSLNGARIAVLLLFFLIEILPVTVKFLQNLGPLTAYESALKSRDDEKVDEVKLERAERRRLQEGESQARIAEKENDRSIEAGKRKAHVQVEEDMRSREVNLGKHANEYVAGEMKKILDLALGQWSKQVQASLSALPDTGGPASGGPSGANPSNNGSSPPNQAGNPTGLPSGTTL